MSSQTPNDETTGDSQSPMEDNDIEQEQQAEAKAEAEIETETDAEAETEASADSDDDGLEQLMTKLFEAEEAAIRAKDDLLRVQAEMQNLRRRTEQDIEKAHKYGQEKFSIQLIGVMDNLERSLEATSNSEDEAVKAIHEGVDLTLKSFIDCFSKFNIEVVDPLGEPFDPLLHQAVSMQENTESEPNTVIAVMQKGYALHGRVIRPAMVMVSK